MIEVILSVLYRISNRKRSLVTHHDSLKMCNDRELPIWLRRKRHGLLGIREEGAGDSELEQTSYVWRETDDQTNNYIGLEKLFAEDEMSHAQAIGQANDARELDKADVEDDGPEAFEDDEPITETDRHSRRGRTLRRPHYLKDHAS